jgi:hypothetical protein
MGQQCRILMIRCEAERREQYRAGRCASDVRSGHDGMRMDGNGHGNGKDSGNVGLASSDEAVNRGTGWSVSRYGS